MEWIDARDQCDEQGKLTPLALALRKIDECDCKCVIGAERLEPCFPCLCEAALGSLWYEVHSLKRKEIALRALLDMDFTKSDK